MGLAATVRRAVADAFKAAGDLVRPVTYQVKGALTRDLVAGTASVAWTSYPIPKSLSSKYEDHEISPTVIALTDEKLIFPAASLPVKPSTADVVIDEDGRTWEIIKVKTDPTKSLITLQVRTTR